MNKITKLINFGFSITWKTILIGMVGGNNIPPQLTKEELLNYLHALLEDETEQEDEIIALILMEDDPENLNNRIAMLASLDRSDYRVQWRKWRVYLLNEVLSNISNDCLQGLLSLMDFWVSTGVEKDCPQVFPQNNNSLAALDYFTVQMFEKLLTKNQNWLTVEINSIQKCEPNTSSFWATT